MDHILILIVLVVPLWLNIKATLAILRDSYSERSQRIMQILLVWLLPLIGPFIVLAVHRPNEKHSGQYSSDPDFLDGHLPDVTAMHKVGEAIHGD